MVVNSALQNREQQLRSIPPWATRLLRSNVEVDMVRPRHVFHYSRVLHLESFRRQERMSERVDRLERMIDE
jgi:hypothetical protein